MDVSGSMYRFNGHDGRLNKMLETTCLVMEVLTLTLARTSTPTLTLALTLTRARGP